MGAIRFLFVAFFLTWAGAARAASPSFIGPLGLNVIPSARMDADGAVRAGVSTLDPVENGFIAVQAADWLNIAVRQTAEISSLNADPQALYPGIDLKVRLWDENQYRPALALGVMGAIGKQVMSGDYLVLSKRYNAFDLTGGMARTRKDGALIPFGGVEVFTPLHGLSLKFDYGEQLYRSVSTPADFKEPSPWAAGVNYAPKPWINLGAAIVGGEKFMAILTLQDTLGRWFGRGGKDNDPQPVNRYRTRRAAPDAMSGDAARYDSAILHDIRRSWASVWARLDARPDEPLPQQIGRAARAMANHAGETAEELVITPENSGLNGPNVRLMRRDLEGALISGRGSPQEIWRHADLNAPPPAELQGDSVDVTRIDMKHRLPLQFRLILDTQLSLAEEDSGVLYRTAAIGGVTERLSDHMLLGAALRVNGPDNLQRLEKIRFQALFPVRSDVARFADKTVSLDRLYHAYLRSFMRGQFHVMAAAGYLEEMYAGAGGEILYRPAGKTWAVGAEAWEALRRDPQSPLASMLNGDHVLSGFLKGYYEIPRTDLTLGLKAGRYLGQDVGGTLSLSKSMPNGAQFEAFVTATNGIDADALGRPADFYSGLRLRLPLGNIPYVARDSEARMAIVPVGRDYGQSLDSPLPLYEMTEPFSARTMIRDWNGIVE